MARSGSFSHRNLSLLFGSQSYSSRYRSLEENIYEGNGSFGTAGSAHVAFMNSAVAPRLVVELRDHVARCRRVLLRWHAVRHPGLRYLGLATCAARRRDPARVSHRAQRLHGRALPVTIRSLRSYSLTPAPPRFTAVRGFTLSEACSFAGELDVRFAHACAAWELPAEGHVATREGGVPPNRRRRPVPFSLFRDPFVCTESAFRPLCSVPRLSRWIAVLDESARFGQIRSPGRIAQPRKTRPLRAADR